MSEPKGEIDERAVRHNLRKFLLVYLAVMVGAVALGFGLGAAVPHHHRTTHAHHGSTAGAIAAIVFGVLVLGATVAAMYWVFHRRSYRRMMQYPWNQRRRVFRALRKGRPLPEEDRPVADAMMYLNRNWRRNLSIMFPIAILYFVLEGAFRTGGSRWMWLFLAVVYACLIPVALWNQHRIERNYHRFVRSGTPPVPSS